MQGGLLNLRGSCSRPMSALLVASVAVVVACLAARSAVRDLLLRRKLRRASPAEPPYPERMMIDDGTSSRLCKLPDDILHSIMAFLPLDEAVRTCILSRRWERLWRSMPCLDFSTLRPHFWEKPHHQLINFINGVCALHDEEFPIQSFYLKYTLRGYDDSDAPLLNSWILSAIKGGVKDLSLTASSPSRNYVLPLCIFSSETLVKLDMRGHRVAKLPAANSMYLPRLKHLHLGAVIIEDGESLEQLFSSPLLEKLAIVSCIFQNNNIKSLKISAPKLRDLRIVATIRNLPTLWLCCDSLDTLFCKVVLENKIHISSQTMKKIGCAALHLEDDCRAADVFDLLRDHKKDCSRAENVFDLLSALSGVKTLTLSGGALEVFNSSLELFWKLPQFKNLIKLTLINFESYGITTVGLLRKTPCLETISFNGRRDRSFLNMPPLDPVPLCFENHIKKIRVSPFRGSDINVLGIMLKACLVLEDVIVWVEDDEEDVWAEDEEEAEDKEEMSVVLDTLSTLPKGSKHCRITIRQLFDE